MGENYVSREELNGSILRLESRVEETNRLVREQSGQMAELIQRETDKRETQTEQLHGRINEAVRCIHEVSRGKVSVAMSTIIAVLSSAAVGLAVALITSR